LRIHVVNFTTNNDTTKHNTGPAAKFDANSDTNAKDIANANDNTSSTVETNCCPQTANSASSSSAKMKRSFSSEVYTIPNLITISRIVASPYLAMLIYQDRKEMLLVGVTLACFSDWLDGFIARRFDQKTVLGGMLDPFADKVVIGSLCCGLAVKGLVPLPLAAVIIGRDVIIVFAGLVMRARERPEGEFFFDSTKVSFKATPSTLSKVNTGVQFAMIFFSLSHYIFSVPDMTLLEPLWFVTAATTVGSGLGYLDGSGLRKLKND
jgi:cardiolipin synthase (CMP-forming)